MNVLGTRKLRHAARQVLKKLTPKGLILMYHCVGEVDLDPWALYVTPQHFAEHLDVLQKYAHPISLQQLAQAHQDSKIPDRAVVVTFDDGYANNLHQAKPLLEHYNIPATVFVATGHIGHQREFWWDELEQALLQPKRLPATLCLEIDGNPYKWELGEAVDYSEEDYRRDRSAKAWESKPGSRLFFYDSVWQRLQPLQDGDRQKVVDEILTWADAKPVVRSTHRSLTLEELCTLGQGELVEIGAHTVTHPFLPAHSLPVQRDEIQQSKAHLEQLLECSVTSFAYPFGNYTPETVSLMPEAGFTCACSCVEDIVWWRSDQFQFPRFGVENWTGEEFAQRLLSWFKI